MPALALTNAQASELAESLLDFEAGAASRGARYADEGRVGPISWDAAREELSATVIGTTAYRATWQWDDGFWETECSCPLGGSCKHAFALGRKALEQARVASAGGEGLPARGNARAGSKPASAANGARLEPLLESLHDRGLKPAEKRMVKQLEQMHAAVARSGYVDGEAITAFARPSNPGLITGASIMNRELAEVFERGRLPADAAEFWEHLAVLFRRRGWQIPSLLEPISNTSGLEARLERRRQARELDEWRMKLRQLGDASRIAPAAPPAQKQLRLRVGPKALVFQTADGAGGFIEVGNDVALSLARRAESTSALEEWDLPSLLLAGMFLEVFHFHGTRKLTLASAETAAALGRALRFSHLEGRVVDEAGQPYTRSEMPLVWDFADDPADETRCVVSLAFADGSAPPEPLLYLGGPPHVYVSGHAVLAGPAPLHSRADAGWKATLPKAALQGEGVVESLMRSASRLPPSVRERVEHLPLRALLRGSIGRDEAGVERLQFTLSGVDRAGVSHMAYDFRGWTPGEVAPPADGRIRFLDTDGTRAAVGQFRQIRLDWDSGGKHWTRAIHSNTPGELYSWLGGFPADTVIELAPELAGLRAPPVRAAFSLQIEESGRDWFDVELVVRSEDARFTPEELALLLKAQGRWARLEGKGWQRLALAADADEESRLADLGLSAEGALPGRQRFHAMQLAAAQVESLAAESAWQRVQERARAIRALPPPDLPPDFAGELRPYQVEGFHFLAHLSAHSLGGILADDMGLGKTVQALAWLLWLAGHMPDGERLRVLVVCPKSVMTNWERETARFVPRLSVGAFRSRAGSGIPDTNIVVANYVQLRGADVLFLAEPWTAVILDEGQNIKNPKSQTAAVARRLQAPHRVVLTGTPIENRVLDLWSLFAFAMPGLLGAQTQFGRLYDDRKDPTARVRLARRARHFLLRRTKSQVAADLPPRVEEDVLCELEGEQRKLYQAELKRARQLVLGISDDRAFDAQRFNILQSLLRLRQICCHPALISEDFASAGSAKVSALFEQLEPILEEGHKVLVFSQFVSMLRILQRELEQREIRHLVLTGQTENRQELVDQFQADPDIPVFLLSLKAAGTGLNLTAASYVVLFDPWWNPAVEAQAIDRTHRIGQTNQVIAYRILAVDTVEEKIRALQREKSALASEVVQEESLARILDLDDLRFVLG